MQSGPKCMKYVDLLQQKQACLSVIIPQNNQKQTIMI